MAGPVPVLGKSSQNVQHEHQQVLQRLEQLKRALDALVCDSEVYADLGSSAEIAQEGRWLAGWLPGHFEREERTVLAGVARLGPAFKAFAGEMKRQHREIGTRADAFCQAAGHLQQCEDLQQSVCELKEQGMWLARTMVAHIGAEERTLASIR